MRGDGASTAGHKRGAGTASGTAGRARRAARDGGADAAGYKRSSGRRGGGTVSGTRRVARGRGENHASSPHPSNEPPKARSFSYLDGISDESDAFWAFMRFTAAQFDQSQTKSPSPAPNPVYSHPFCRIAECGPELDDGEVQRRSNRRAGDDTRGRGDARGRYTRAEAIHEGGGVMLGPNTTKQQLKDGTQLQSLWSDRRTRPESPKPRGEGLSPIGTIRFGGV